MAVNVDDVFKEIGDFGSYQKRIYFLLCLPILFVGAGSLAYVFIAAAPEYRCLVPKCDINRTNPTYNESFIYFTIPYLNASANYDECHRYQRLNDNDSCLPEDYSKSNTTECPEGKVFADDVFVSTIVTEFNLTCHNAWKSQMAQTVYFAGVLVGAFSFGIVADLTGRRVTIMIVIIIMAVSGITIALVPGLTTFNVLRFINAMATTGLFQTSFVLGMEFVGPSKRVMCGIIGEYFFALGEELLGLIAWWLKDWRMIQLLISAPVSCFIFYWWFIPESPRWLHAQGKDRKLVAVLEKVAKGNNKTFSPLFWNDNNGIEANDLPGVKTIKVVTLLDILKTPLLCCRMFSMFFIW
ncbi:organic cation transporter protein isoform X1 [Cherax quadricarinatus]